MFDRISEQEVRRVVDTEALVVCCASFEARCVTATQRLIESGEGQLRGNWAIVELDDDKSFFRAACRQAREKNLGRLREVVRASGGVLTDDGLKREWPLSDLNALVETLLALLGRHAGPVILDVTTMPKALFFPVFRELLRHGHSRELLVAYTRPMDYPSELSRDFEDVSYLGGFVGKFAAGKPLAWIPVLGFQGGLARKIYDWGGFGSRVSPIVGFPSLAVDRVLYANREIIDQLTNDIDAVSFCPIDDPDAVSTRVRELADQFRQRGFHVTLSPLGTKLQSLGACVAAIDLDLTVLYAQPRTYHPLYSTGSASTAWFRIRPE